MTSELFQKIVDELSQLNCFLREQAILSTTPTTALQRRILYEKWAKEAGFHQEFVNSYPWDIRK